MKRHVALLIAAVVLAADAGRAQEPLPPGWTEASRLFAEGEDLVAAFRRRSAELPHDPWSRYFLALSALEAGLLDEAERSIAAAETLHPGEALFAAVRARIATVRKQHEPALAAWREAARRESREPQRALYREHAEAAADRVAAADRAPTAAIVISVAGAFVASALLLVAGRTRRRVPADVARS